MTQMPSSPESEFDAYAAQYDEALAKGISVSGEDKNYFAQGRIAWLHRCLKEHCFKPQTALDYGCGTGSAAPFLLQYLGVQSVLGVDISVKLVERATQTYGSSQIRFVSLEAHQPDASLDIAFCNGVFHHIPPDQRDSSVQCILQSLKPGGMFALWENNPWNPGTRYVMSRIPFDKDAITLTPPEARILLKTNGFNVLSTNYLFIFPRSLGFLRGLEPPLAHFPFGTQYQILCRKP